jgi:hypothetical protein
MSARGVQREAEMNNTAKCQGVCESESHADNGEAAPVCDLYENHTEDEQVPGGYIAATPHECEECWNNAISAVEAAYERAYYGE